MKYGYCLGVRLDGDFMEKTCEHRDGCPYYGRITLSEALSHPDRYEEVDTYNDKECKLYQL